MKTQLKDGIWIEGFDKLSEVYAFKDNMCIVGEAVPYIYIGKTSEISEEMAKELITQIGTYFIGDIPIYKNYTDEQHLPVMKRHQMLNTKQAIQSACSQEYCIIYKTK